jgi:hypothetical protein
VRCRPFSSISRRPAVRSAVLVPGRTGVTRPHTRRPLEPPIAVQQADAGAMCQLQAGHDGGGFGWVALVAHEPDVCPRSRRPLQPCSCVGCGAIVHLHRLYRGNNLAAKVSL